MTIEHEIQEISSQYIVEKNHNKSNYFDAIKRLVEAEKKPWMPRPGSSGKPRLTRCIS
jgi:hypothetical protein